MRLVVALTGASGIVYGTRLLAELGERECETHVIITENAKKLMAHETGMHQQDLARYATFVYDENDMESPLASGSFRHDAMVIAPCSLKTLAAVAHGIAFNLVTRAAICCLKERRKLIIVPRETPLDLISLENAVTLTKAGGIILPAMPAFYHKPASIDDLINYVIGKIMDQLDIDHDLYRKWE